jgi:hypothetical protein
MSTISNVGKVAYLYDQPTDTWYPMAGYTNTTESFSWSGPHTFTNTVNFNTVLNAKGGVNNFERPSDRNTAIPAPAEGTVVFVRLAADGSVINQIQYWSNGAWRTYGENAQLLSKTQGDFTLALTDSGRTIDIDSATNVTVTIPANITGSTFPVGTQIAFIRSGTGQVNFITASGGPLVTLQSKNGNKRIAAQYSPATLIHKGNNVWILIGDLTA